MIVRSKLSQEPCVFCEAYPANIKSSLHFGPVGVFQPLSVSGLNQTAKSCNSLGNTGVIEQ